MNEFTCTEYYFVTDLGYYKVSEQISQGWKTLPEQLLWHIKRYNKTQSPPPTRGWRVDKLGIGNIVI